ncbi:uncharacterized protein TRUGW13939_09877 [Talaromyces rugulosus]|uniref:Uncharacterized protein n=1 Tax=Talaromyces rugulosus TaxID=121627 RepID=A0A7H8RB77_TALRU|nr:uncharacterized protein TRUGW13939_09877 [Talaromyces rugulosus]QKX62715.1 hypothetical protein TRUGW13939_09877 [Talaromyces rugulosus]
MPLWKSKEKGRNLTAGEKAKATLQTLLSELPSDIDDVLANTTPPNNIIHVIERMQQRSKSNAFHAEGKKAIIRYTLGWSQDTTSDLLEQGLGIIGTIDAIAERTGLSADNTNIAKYAYYCLMDPKEVGLVYNLPRIRGDFEKFIGFAQGRNFCNSNVARMRRWQEIPKDELREIFVSGRSPTEKDARREYCIRQLMKDQKLDHSDAERLFEQSSDEPRDTKVSMGEESEISKYAADCRVRHFQQPMYLPTRDTRAPPNVDPRTRVVAVLGVDETGSGVARDIASPSIGDGWMVSDFNLWMHVLDSMGKSQEWITSMDPEYIVSKYCLRDNTTREPEDDNLPIQKSWVTGFLHGDPFEERVVVLDENLLPAVRQKVTISPHGLELRNLFMNRLEHALAEAEKDAGPVLVMIFAHGENEQGGFLIGESSEGQLDESPPVSRLDISELLQKYPKAHLTMFMTSCYSGHWVETQPLQCQNLTVLAAAQREEESFGFEWSLSQRHCGGLFSSATLTELLKEPSILPSDVDNDTSRQYKQMVNAIIAEMFRLCLPQNITDYGSKPVFTDPNDLTKFWKRTGYTLHEYQKNYSSLTKIPPSDPHPKTNRKQFNATFIDDNHPDILAWNARHPGILDPEYPTATGGYGGTSRGLTSRTNIKFLIHEFMGTNPWLHLHDQKMLERLIREFKGGTKDSRILLGLRTSLIHRLRMNDEANNYARAMDFYKLPPIDKWGPITNHPRGTIMRQWGYLVLHSGVFDRTPSGYWYMKPCFYLAWGALEAGLNEYEFKEALFKLAKSRKEGMVALFSSKLATSARLTKSVSNLKSLLRQSWSQSKTKRGNQGRKGLSEINWTEPSSSGL